MSDNSIQPSVSNFFKNRKFLLSCFRTGIEEVRPRKVLPRNLNIIDKNQIRIGKKIYNNFKYLNPICIGKASVEMGISFNKIFMNSKTKFNFKIKKGFIVVNKENFKKVRNFNCFFGGHPLPDENGIKAADYLTKYLKSLGKDDLIILMLSGGGSAMLPHPPNPISLDEKTSVSKMLLSCGADIKEINTVRKHLSLLKGGKFLEYSYPARTSSLIISDVVGDDLSSISSGLTVKNRTTFNDAVDICKKYKIWNELPENILKYLTNAITNSKKPKKNKMDNDVFKYCKNEIIASNSISLNQIQTFIKKEISIFNCKIWKKNIEGNVKEVAFKLVEHASKYSSKRPLIFLSGGETTVKLSGSGLGGRNQEFALYVCIYMKKLMPKKKFVFLSGGTDGRDGPTDSAGGIVDHTTLDLCKNKKIDIKRELNNNNSYYILKHLNSHIKINGTNTNVADIQILLLT